MHYLHLCAAHILLQQDLSFYHCSGERFILSAYMTSWYLVTTDVRLYESWLKSDGYEETAERLWVDQRSGYRMDKLLKILWLKIAS